MLEVNIRLGNGKETVCTFEGSVTAGEVGKWVAELRGIALGDFYILRNGRLSRDSDVCDNGAVEIVPRLPGGKGGFGSMLRAIGAQIEKTTNREACRDLSGRRLRDINEEKRLKSWIDKQATREEEAVERKKKKLERLCAQPRHEFKDKNYEKERSTLTEKVGDAVEEGFKLAMAAGGPSGAKRKLGEDQVKAGRKRLALDPDIDSDELGSSSDESDSDARAEAGSSTHSQQDEGRIGPGDAEGDGGGTQKTQESVEEEDSGDLKGSDHSAVKKGVEGVAVM